METNLRTTVALNSCETEAWYLLFSNRLSRKSNTLIFQVVRFIEATRGFLPRLHVSDVMLAKKKCQISYVVRIDRQMVLLIESSFDPLDRGSNFEFI